MSFGNNIEAMASEKSGWAIIDQSADGSVIYMGKPVNDNVGFSDQAWLIKKITTETKDDGSQIIKTQYAEPKYKSAWNDRKDLEYLPKLKGLKTFFIADCEIEIGGQPLLTTYYYEEGMTWGEFINSEYNIDHMINISDWNCVVYRSIIINRSNDLPSESYENDLIEPITYYANDI